MDESSAAATGPTYLLASRITLQSCDHYFPSVPKTLHVKWVHCHHGMARPRVADRGDGLQIWRVAANILNKQ
jgi:hypothetical protein